MNGETLRRTFTVVNPNGLHLRPIQAFVAAALKFADNEVSVCKPGGEKINGKSAFGLMTMLAEQGTELTVEVSGPDPARVMHELLDILGKTSWDDPPNGSAPQAAAGDQGAPTMD